MPTETFSKEQLKTDDKTFLWHPFTQMQEWQKEDPLIIERADGNLLIDTDGNRYIDGVSSLWTNVHGHRVAPLDQAVRDQLDQVAHTTMLGLSNVPAIAFAKKLVEITPPGLSRVFYSDNGSTAVEVALKMAFQYCQQRAEGSSKKNTFITLTNAYHGDTIGSVSVGGIDLFHHIYRPLLFETIQVASPYCYRCPVGDTYPGCHFSCLRPLEETMEKRAHEVCALVIEPLVQGAAGILVQPPGYLRQIRDLCIRYGVLMIADEVAVGFGKTGKMFACEQEEVAPDLMALGKGITGGYLPLAATMATEEIYQGFLGHYEDFKAFFHGHTYTGNPLACAAGLANMALFEENNVLQALQPKISALKDHLDEMRTLAHVGEVRQCGIMVGIELVAHRGNKEPYPLSEKIGHKVIMEARKHGLIIRPLGNVVVLMPPLSITMEQLERMCHITGQAIMAVTG